MYDRESYQRNRENHKKSVYNWRDKNREKYNEYKKEWKRKNFDKVKKQKKKDDAKYHAKMKSEPEYLQKRREAAREYNNRKEVKDHRRKINAKRRAKPEVKKANAIYNKKFHQDNPDLVLKNTRKHLEKIGAFHNLKWHQMLDHLRGWSEIIHKDCDETCQICFAPSQQAHHIFHKTKYPQLAFNRNNGIALCTKCHNETHGKMLITNKI